MKINKFPGFPLFLYTANLGFVMFYPDFQTHPDLQEWNPMGFALKSPVTWLHSSLDWFKGNFTTNKRSGWWFQHVSSVFKVRKMISGNSHLKPAASDDRTKLDLNFHVFFWKSTRLYPFIGDFPHVALHKKRFDRGFPSHLWFPEIRGYKNKVLNWREGIEKVSSWSLSSLSCHFFQWG